MSVASKLQNATWRDWLRWVIQLGVAGWIVWILCTQGVPNADSWSSILALGIGLVGSFIQNPRVPLTFEDVLPGLRTDVRRYWSRERERRGLHRKRLLSVTLTNVSSPASAPLVLDYGAWEAKAYSDKIADLLLTNGPLLRKAMIFGEGGVGKTTFAVLLTNGLAKRDGIVPLYLSLASWSPRDETFTGWCERQVLTTYPRLRQILPTPDSLVRELLISDEVLLILDGLDELRDGQVQGDALKEINACIDDDMPVLLLTRPDPTLELLDAQSLRLELIDSAAVTNFLTTTAASILSNAHVPLTHQHAWVAIRDQFAAGASAALNHLLSRPLYLDLLVRTGLRNPSLSVEFLQAISQGVEEAKRVLYRSFVDDVLDARSDLGRRQARLARRLAVQMAAEMSKPPVARTMAWWRLCARVPASVFGAAMTPLTAPAYQLCLFMPAGLTRGFALGTITGVVLGMCRGVETRTPACVAAAVAGSGAAIMAVGTFWVGWRIAAVDAVEIAPIVGLVFRWRHILVAGTWHKLRTWGEISLAVARAGALSALITCGAAAALAPGADPPRSLSGVFMAVCLALVVATVAARLLTSPAEDLSPATASFQPRGNPLPHIVAATTAATAVGMAGGFVGGLAHGPLHGLHVALFFGAVAGPGIGLAGGLIRWLNQPGPQTTATAERLYRHDRFLAVLSVVGVAAGASAGLAALHFLAPEFMQSLSDGSFAARPVEGILFGATIGVIVAVFNTAWPNYAVCMAWFTIRSRVPWSLLRYLDLLHTCGVLRQEGSLYSFRDEGLQLHLAQ